jgi:hypothetical protein
MPIIWDFRMNTSNKTYGEVVFSTLDPPSIEKAFNAGWYAGFREAIKPDKYPHQDRCSVAFEEWISEHLAKAKGE